MLRDDINAALKDAMKTKDQRRVATLRLINAAIQNAELAQTAGKTLSDEELQGVLQHMVKQRRDALKIYQQAGRSELAAKEQEEIEVISAYLPKLMSEEEAKTMIGAVVKELNAQGAKDMGKVMTALKTRFDGRMDFGKASAVVKTMLSG
jgi:uncharacterized protein YqeY